jgi:drug/metabolite transporter (DMT)-like permease
MVVAMAGFTTGDAITKSLLETMNVGQVILVRGVFATTLIALVCWRRGAFARRAHLMHPMVALRSLGELCGSIFFTLALSHMPLANLSAVMQALPLAVSMAAALFLGEAVGWRRWLAISIGFAGVMVIVRPGFEGFNSFSLLAMMAVLSFAIRDLATAKVPKEVPTMLISAVTAAVVTVTGAALIVPFGGWSTMSIGGTALLAAAAVILLLSYQCIILALRLGDISFAAPFRYTALLCAIAYGYFLFGEVPDAYFLIGAAIVVASGLYTLYRERVVGRGRPATESTGPSMAPDGL